MKKLVAMGGFSVNGSGKSRRTPIYHGVQKGNPTPLLPLNHDFNGGNGIVNGPKGGLNWNGGQEVDIRYFFLIF